MFFRHIIKVGLLEQGDKARVIQTLLFMSGINTLLQTWFGSRLPVIMGSSIAFFIPVMSTINGYVERDFSSSHEVRIGHSFYPCKRFSGYHIGNLTISAIIILALKSYMRVYVIMMSFVEVYLYN